MRPSTTISDIAQKLGLSSSSVSKALAGNTRGNNTRISPETMRRVQEAAREMNYRGNSSARAMRARRFNNIGFFDFRHTSTAYSFSNLYLNGISKRATRMGQNVVLARVPQHSEDMADLPRILREEGLDALIIASGTAANIPFQQAVEAGGIPVIYLNEKRPTNAVYINDVAGARMITAHLVERGFRRIAMLAPPSSGNHYSTADRISGYLGILREAGLAPILKTYDDLTWRYETRDWLARPDQRPDAIFCVDDLVALMLQRILYDLRLHVPGDIAIAGCNGEQFSLYSTVPLTTLEIPFQEMAAQAFDMALKCAGRKTMQPIPSVVFEPRLIVRESSLNRLRLASLPRLHLHENEADNT